MKGRLADRAWQIGEGVVLHTRRTVAPFLKGAQYIEHVIADEYADAIYRSELVSKWMEENGIEPLDFGGHVIAYPVTLMKDIPLSLLKRIRYYDSRGKRRRVTAKAAQEIKDAIERAAAEEM